MKFKKALLPLILLTSLSACNSATISIEGGRLTTPKINKVSDKYQNQMSQKTYDSYLAFAKKFTSFVMDVNNLEDEKSLGISIPDAYICLAITGVLSKEESMDDVLSYLELSSLEELRTAIKEVISTLGTLFKDYEGKLSGGYNLNSVWYNPDKVRLLKEKDEELYKDLEEVFDASLYHEALTSDKANQYLKDNGLKDLPTPTIQLDDDDPSAMSVMSVYYCIDYFIDHEFYKQQYQSGKHKMDYTYSNNTSKVDYIEKRTTNIVYENENFYGAYMGINRLDMAFFLPNDKNALPSSILNDVLNENYHNKKGKAIYSDGREEETEQHNIHISAPYFSLNNSASLENEDLNKILPVISDKFNDHGAGARIVEPRYELGYEYLFLDYIKQFSVMKFNYDGFYSCSVTIGGYGGATSAEPVTIENFELTLDHPYVFEVRKMIRVNEDKYVHLPIVIGEIVTPNYQD